MNPIVTWTFAAACGLSCFTGTLCAADLPRASFGRDLVGGNAAWSLGGATETPAKDPQSAIATLSAPAAMTRDGSGWSSSNGAKWRVDNGHIIAEPGSGTASAHAVASYTVPAGGAGFYALSDSELRVTQNRGRIELRVFVRRAGAPTDRQPEPAVYAFVDGGEVFDFDTFLGYLAAGDSVYVTLGPDGDAAGDATEIDFAVDRTPSIAVSDFPANAADTSRRDVAGEWSVLNNVPNGSAAARSIAWGRSATSPAGKTAKFALASNTETIVAFRAPHSGYYALDNASAALEGTANVEARLYVGDDTKPRRTFKASSASPSLNTDIGYVAKGETVALALAGTADASVSFSGSIIEWAPRRAPVRVHRGSDGYLDVFASEASNTAIDIPKDRWVEVPTANGDATAAIRAAFDKAKSLGGDGWAGVRLAKGATYAIATDMNGGNVFEFKDISRIVLDGNGATLDIPAPEIQRKGFNLFTTNNGANNLVFADLAVTSKYVPFTVGKVIDVNPKTGNTQTMTVEMEPSQPDPLKEIIRNGRTSAYLYDALIPGRMGFGTWSHYPGSGDGPQLVATDKPGVFAHAVTRTGSSLNIGDKWLVKNKGGGLVYLVTRGNCENITLSNIDGRAAGGGTLRFWATSGINILNCRFEPEGDHWISSSADGIHGRGREGVWVEDTIQRGICEDIMNTYGRTMAVKADSINGDTLSLGVFENSVRSSKGPLLKLAEDDVRVGDRLVFFSPQSGKVLGYAHVVTRDGETIKLSKAVDGIVPWTTTNPRELTQVYSIDAVGNFVVRDSKFMDSMRIGIYIKAQGGVVFGNTLEGLPAPGVFAVNEPEWPEGPPATHLWVQGNTFSQNNYGYMSRNRDFIVGDPADISVYTRKFRGANEPDDFNAFVSRGQHANSHVKIVGNVFHDWRGMGIAVRNAKNVVIEDNLFLPPVQDEQMRKVLGEDKALSSGGAGRYAALFLDSVSGARVSGNRFVGLPAGDLDIVRDQAVEHVVASDNAAAAIDRKDLDVSLSFSEWFGGSGEAAKIGAAQDVVELRGATHGVGRLGAGLVFDGKDARAVLKASADVGGKPASALSVALWVRSDAGGAMQTIYAQGNADHGIVIAIDKGRLLGGLCQSGKGAWVDLGPAVEGLWQHVALVLDSGTLRGFIDANEVASAKADLGGDFAAISGDAMFGGAGDSVRLAADRVVAAKDAGAYRGAVDEFRRYGRAISPTEIGALALRRVAAVR